MTAITVLTLIFALMACCPAIIVPFCKDNVHAMLGFLASSFGMAGLFLCMGLEILAAVSMIFYAVVTIMILLAIFPFRETEKHENRKWPVAAGGVIILFLAGLCLRAGMFMGSVTSKDSVHGILSPDFARYLIENYYFPLGVSVFLLLAVLLGGYLAVGRSGR